MAFPQSALPVTVEIAPGADPAGDSGTWSWTDITSSVRYSKRLGRYINIEHGAPPEATRVDPSTCRLWLDNRTGDFTPRNPNGQYYGSLGRNTPIRVRLQWAKDAFGRTTSNGWGTSDSGQVWTTSGGAASDYSTTGSAGRQSLTATGDMHFSFLNAGRTNADMAAAATIPVVPSGGGVTLRLAARMADTSNYYAAQLFVAAGGAADLRIFRVVGGAAAQIAGATSLGTHSAGNVWGIRFQTVGSILRAKAWKVTDAEPAFWQLEINDSSLTSGTNCGCLSRRESGNTNGTVNIDWDNVTVTSDRFSGFVSSWPLRWDKSGNDATVPIQADGVLRRLGQGNPPSLSPLARAILASDPLAYWPCEDGEAASMVGSAMPGGTAAALSGPTPTFGESRFAPTNPYGTQAMVDLAGGTSITATLPAAATAATATRWTVHGWFELAPGTGNDLVVMEWDTPGGTYVRWQLVFSTTAGASREVYAFDSAGVRTTVFTAGGWQTALWPYTISAAQNGGNIDLVFDGLTDTTPDTASLAGTLAGVTAVRANPDQEAVPFLAGHLAVWDITTVPYRAWHENDSYGTRVYGAFWSWLYETTHDRLARLCDEQGLTLTAPAVSGDFVTRMGPQPAGTFLDLAYECADADQGVLYESGFGLGYVPREARYNRTVDLAVDFDSGQVAEPPEPTDDDQRLSNRVTVKRSGGSSAVAQDADSIAVHGRYEDESTVNHAYDTDLADHAAWRVHLGTADAMRWPRIDLNLAASPDLIDDWLACGIGSRVTADNPPDQVAGDDIDVIVEGYSETLGFKDWSVTLNCSPAQPWTVATAGGEPRVDTDGATLTSSVTSSATSFSVTSTGTVWTTDPSDTPFDINVGGERMRVDAVGTLINANPFFETNTTGWSAQSSTIARSTAQVHDDGDASLLITPDGVSASGGVQADLSAVGTITAGASYIACLWAYSPGGWSDLRACVDWYDSAGAFLSTGLGSASSVSAGSWTFLKQTLTAPVSASRARVRARHGGTPAAGNVWYVWGVRLISVASTTSPQTFTVSRSRNGIVKAHAAGTAVNVWSPAYVAL